MQTSDNPSSTVVDLNNRVASYFRDGLYLKAVKDLSAALSLLRETARKQKRSCQLCLADGSNMATVGSMCEFAAAQESPRSGETMSDIWNCKTAHRFQLPYVFHRPICVSDQIIRSHKSIEYLSYAIIFNLALAQHLNFMESKSENSLRKAISLYEFAQRLLVLQNLEVSALHPMAILNNLGHAHDCLRNVSKAHMCFKQLLMAIMYVTESGESCAALVGDLTLDGFFRNALPLVGTICTAPAA